MGPGPVWTPLIPSSFEEEKVEKFGSSCPMGRAAQPEEIAPSYVFLASNDASYFSGQVLHPNGKTIGFAMSNHKKKKKITLFCFHKVELL